MHQSRVDRPKTSPEKQKRRLIGLGMPVRASRSRRMRKSVGKPPPVQTFLHRVYDWITNAAQSVVLTLRSIASGLGAIRGQGGLQLLEARLGRRQIVPGALILFLATLTMLLGQLCFDSSLLARAAEKLDVSDWPDWMQWTFVEVFKFGARGESPGAAADLARKLESNSPRDWLISIGPLYVSLWTCTWAFAAACSRITGAPRAAMRLYFGYSLAIAMIAASLLSALLSLVSSQGPLAIRRWFERDPFGHVFPIGTTYLVFSTFWPIAMVVCIGLLGIAGWKGAQSVRFTQPRSEKDVLTLRLAAAASATLFMVAPIFVFGLNWAVEQGLEWATDRVTAPRGLYPLIAGGAACIVHPDETATCSFLVSSNDSRYDVAVGPLVSVALATDADRDFRRLPMAEAGVDLTDLRGPGMWTVNRSQPSMAMFTIGKAAWCRFTTAMRRDTTQGVGLVVRFRDAIALSNLSRRTPGGGQYHSQAFVVARVRTEPFELLATAPCVGR